MKNEMDTLPLGRCARLLLGLLIAVASLAAAQADESPEETAIAKVIDDSIGWFATKDFDRMVAAFADDAEFFIFHPGRSRRFAAEAFREYSQFFHDPDLVYAEHEIRDLRINTSPARDAAWFSALLDDCSTYKGEKSCWKDCRWTGVY